MYRTVIASITSLLCRLRILQILRRIAVAFTRDMAMQLCFAYGSNMDFGQMIERCPSARFRSVAKLPNHRLAFTRKSTNRGCGVSAVVQEQGSDVWGVVYGITDSDLARLDNCEGYSENKRPEDCAYVRRKEQVLEDGRDDKPLTVWIYFANPQPNPPLPNIEYKRLIVEGAKHWCLPAAYITRLEQIVTQG